MKKKEENLIEIMKSFNRKERSFLIAQALGLHSDCGETAFSLSESFRNRLNKEVKKVKKIRNVEIPDPKEREVFVAMDYHLDWLQAALSWKYTSPVENYKFCNEGKVIEGTQQDIDLLVAFEANGKCHLILVEAKAYSSWTNRQLSSKACRLRKIFGETGKKWCDVRPYFYVISPERPKQLKTACLPEWMCDDRDDRRELQWLCFRLPKERRVVKRRDDSKYFEIKVETRSR